MVPYQFDKINVKQTINTKQEAFNIFKDDYPPEYFEDEQLPFEGNITMSSEFNELYDVIKDATKPCGKDTSFTGSEHINECRNKKRDYYTELIEYLNTLKVPLQKALVSNRIFKGNNYRYLNDEEQIALQKTSKTTSQQDDTVPYTV